MLNLIVFEKKHVYWDKSGDMENPYDLLMT